MLEELIVRHCAPTLARLKTGSLFSCGCPDVRALNAELARCNRLLLSKGVRVLPLCRKQGRTLIYVYRPGRLQADLESPRSGALLRALGYPLENPSACIAYLSRRLAGQPEFPHEIGLFLSYPPDDVEAFIRHKGKNCKLIGCWKVYTDEAEARRRFALFERCTRFYCKKYLEERSILRLTVAA